MGFEEGVVIKKETKTPPREENASLVFDVTHFRNKVPKMAGTNVPTTP